VTRLPIRSEADVATAMRAGRAAAEDAGLSVVEAQHVATAVTEVAMNAWRYAVGGEMVIEPLERDGRHGVRIVVTDRGPGIADIGAALSDGVSSSGSLGVGLPGARRLMDEFDLRTAVDTCTVIEMEKWAGGRSRDPARWTLCRVGGAVPFAQRIRNGVLLGIVAGEYAEQAAALCTAQAWRPPPELVLRCHGLHPPGRPLTVALASLSALDGGLAWLGAGAVEAAVIRLAPEGHTVFRPPGHAQLEGDSPVGLRAQTLSVRRDDALVLAAAELVNEDLVALARAAPRLVDLLSGRPGLCVARIDRGALEPRRAASTLN
jgi:serine/threonine-protein kinase RsbT